MIYSELLDLIKQCEGSFVTIIKDYDKLNRVALNSIKKSLSSEYKILECNYSINYILDVVLKTKEKTILIVNSLDVKIGREIRNDNDNLIVILLKRSFDLFNNNIHTNDAICVYLSTVTFLLKDKKIKVIKSRYTNGDEVMDMNNFSRKMKLQNINKIS